MIVYFDTSALIPLLVTEPGTPPAQQAWVEAHRVASSRIAYVEAAAALAQAHRMKRLTDLTHHAAYSELESLYQQLDLIEVTDSLVRRAARLAKAHNLRGYDALHCAAAESIADPELVVAAGDQAILRACMSLGFATLDTCQKPAPKE